MSTTQLHPITRSATSTSSWKRLAAVAAATVALGLVPVGAAAATTAPSNAAQPVAAVTHDSPFDRDNDMQQQRQHDRQRDQRQDRRAETIVLDEILAGWNSGSSQL